MVHIALDAWTEEGVLCDYMKLTTATSPVLTATSEQRGQTGRNQQSGPQKWITSE